MRRWLTGSLLVLLVGGIQSIVLARLAQAQLQTDPAPVQVRGSGPPSRILLSPIWMHEERTTPPATRRLQRHDPWIARDKALHLSYSFLWTLSSQYVLTHKTALSHNRSIPWALASGAAVGFAKELYDYRRPRGFFSWRDITADAVGIGLAAGLIML